jgi:Ca-activated chloride channel homolog
MKTRIGYRLALMLVGLLFLATTDGALAYRSGVTAGGLRGTVSEGSTGKGLPGATVFIMEAGLQDTTDGNGNYAIKGIASGSYTVKASKPGYVAMTRKGVSLGTGTKKLNFTLSSQGKKVEKEKPKEDKTKHEAKKDMMMAEEAMAPVASMKMSRKVMGARPPSRPRPSPVVQPQPHSGETVVEHNTESYDRIYENPFLSVEQNPLSTFSIDVDTASYANSRRFITQSNRLPPKDAVRIEEFINYFSYDYPNPDGKTPFSVTTEISKCPWSTGHRLVHIGLQGKKLKMDKLPNSNLVFLMDVSGSMNNADKLPLLKAAFKLLVNNLREEDRVAIVVYAGAAGLVLPSTPGSKREKIIDSLNSLSAGGSTAGGAGIKLAYKVAKENFIKGGNNRVILATDGDFNIGASSDAEMVRLIEEKRKAGIFLTVLGFGSGNLKDSKMEQLADKGNGNYGYIDSILEAKKMLVSEMGGTLFTIAKDVKIQIEFNPAKVKGYRLIGYENRMLKKEDFNDDTKDAGELGAGHTVTALYEIISAGSEEELPGVDKLKYQKTKSKAKASKSNELMTVKLRYKKPDGNKSKLIEHPVKDKGAKLKNASDNFRWSAAVAMFGLILRDSEFKGDASFKKVLSMAKKATGKDTEGYRFEFLKLVEQAELLSDK